MTASQLPLNCVVRRLVLYESSLLRLLTMVILERLCRECSKQMPCNTGPSLDPHPLGLPEDKEVCLACLSLSHNQHGDWQKRKEKARKGGKREGGGKWVIDSSLSTHHSVLISAHAICRALTWYSRAQETGPARKSCLVSWGVDEQCTQTKVGVLC